MTRYKFTIEYLGTDYAGWQRQKEDATTIQGEIEKAIKAFSGQEVTIQCAGRTDAGVHAWGQVAHGDLDEFTKPMEAFEITKAINAHLRPQSISILHTQAVDDEFHARFAAKNKLYVYRILNRQSSPAIESGHVWHIRRPLDAKAMHGAGQNLLGKHDFSTFRDSECQANTPIRTLDRLAITTQSYDDHDGPGSGTEIRIEAEAQSFLHHMVRNIVGTLTLVGEGKWDEKDFKTALDAKDRTRGGPTAPAAGLYLKHIRYP